MRTMVQHGFGVFSILLGLLSLLDLFAIRGCGEKCGDVLLNTLVISVTLLLIGVGLIVDRWLI
jgi:hypothetical protein